jgi:hypothetical protein
MSGQPYLKFFPTDWQGDECVALLSLAARGLWWEMLLIIHKAGGYLRTNGRALSEPELARMVRADTSEVAALIEELETAGVFSRDDAGTIFSRRILRDLKKAEADKSNGKLGGNPLLKRVVKGRVKRPVNGEVKPHGARPESTSDFLTEEEEGDDRASPRDADGCAVLSAAPPSTDDDKEESQKEIKSLLGRVETEFPPLQRNRIVGRLEVVHDPAAYLHRCLASKGYRDHKPRAVVDAETLEMRHRIELIRQRKAAQ